MSYDAENRNNRFVCPLLTRDGLNNYVSSNINHFNYCSFCDSNEHNVTTCNNPCIKDFYNVCLMHKLLISHLEENPRSVFKGWLVDRYLHGDDRLLRAFAYRLCNCRLTNNIYIIFEKITNYFYEDIYTNPFNYSSYIDDFNLLSPLSLHLITAVLTSGYYDDTTTTKFNITINVQEQQVGDEQQIGDEICECGICYEDTIPKKHQVTLNCKHQICKDCFTGCLKTTSARKEFPTCAFCRANISEITVHSEEVKNEFAEFVN